MDGKFVKNKTWTFSEIKKLTSYSHLPLDVHLMVEKPEKYIEDYALLNTNDIIFHYEEVKDVENMIDLIKSYGLKVGIAVNPDTNVEVLFPFLNKIDLVLIMSVYPGESGQLFIENSLNKIKVLKEEIIKQEVKTLIEVDGGINDENAILCKEAGVDILVSASFIHKDIINNIDLLKKL
jgi:ribulose-phosphate 3-epimerase